MKSYIFFYIIIYLWTFYYCIPYFQMIQFVRSNSKHGSFFFFKPTRKGEHLCKCTELSLKRKEGIHRNISSKFVFLDVYNISPDRAINYDEKDPFLCNACGFCKYAKFDFTLTAKPCCAVDPIETEEDRKKVSLYLYLPQH